MKTFMIILLVICSILIAGRVEANNPKRKYLNPGILNPCLRPNAHKGCQRPQYKPRTPVNSYSRGCSTINRCRRQTP
ncbi:unnamed protein product [Arabidopsis lyrata]|uniref:Uncharacterized protein n=2 Tax=Arabidopsis TaxID=3701 RepID=D7L5V4_ARALL|nr:protein RALF-like 25 [Arabidopsis lyrata subsp. lyrata]EFH61943.1 hypothetical protein ARALYDRAFT_899114 [Arabidopsis lyrata subsp. lyrata]KAG7578632.1 Rapid ALkalinization Factor [Arabidopsis thaliana x Arabidopsis arenosa]CAH8261790.1 unnamed protein product [Arabidopsis lyrata]|eukprot:XP_002885684.1 protein RALF-like 25 [Arabidopsis lyrata subsp. lyrata]